ncbi:MAG: hypothetical protein U0457_12415 [Candidatus Sericytochromatia bacterium]
MFFFGEKKRSNIFTGENHNGNYVYSAAMNLAWNELSENIIKEKIKLKTTKKKSLKLIEKFNNSSFSKNDLDENSYYIKSGFGEKTLNEINHTLENRFFKSKKELFNFKVNDKCMMSFAYFIKKVEYLNEFKEEKVFFKNKSVKGFMASNEKHKENIKVLNYKSNDSFIIKIQLKNDEDELFLAKGYKMEYPEELVKIITENDSELTSLNDNDVFSMPKLAFNFTREYKELIKLQFDNKNFQEYFISKMFETIKFEMNYKGAIIENKAFIDGVYASIPPKIDYRKFLLNSPFWVIMKRKNSKNPFFILGINNVNIMEVV